MAFVLITLMFVGQIGERPLAITGKAAKIWFCPKKLDLAAFIISQDLCVARQDITS
jgi:hypothetical protein